MRRALRLLAFLVLVLAAFSVPLSALAASAQQNVAEPYIVTFSPTVHGADAIAAALAQRSGFKVEHSFNTVIKGFSARLTPSQVAFLRATSQVVNVEVDAKTHITDQTVPTGIERIGTLSNATANIDGNGGNVNIDVATLDTGIDPTHPDLNVAGGYNCTSSNTSAWADDNGHGTHVAGTIAAKDNNIGVVGVAPGARLWAVKVFNSNGNGYVSWIICGMNWIAQHSSTIKVANFSGAWYGQNTANCGVSTHWWVPTDTAHQAVCNLVNTYGVPFVVAAGNSGTDASNTLPAAYPETIAVGAIADSDGKPGGLGQATPYGADDTRATFSNYGPAVTLYAPGVDIYSTWLNGGYATLSGTSMATPHVTGAVALYLVNHPGATPAQVEQALVANGEPGSWGAPYGSQPLLNVDNAAFGGGVVTPVHDVEVTSITPANSPSQGTADTVTVHIDNQGNQPESNLSVTLKDGSATVGTQNVASLSAGNGQDVNFTWTPTTSGNHTLTGSVTYGATTHSNTTTVNVAAVTHTIAVTSVAPAGTAFDGVANTITVHVQNTGNQPESGISVTLTDDGNQVGSPQPVSGTLQPGTGADVNFSWTPNGTGNHTVVASAQNSDANDSKTVTVNVAAVNHSVVVSSINALSTAYDGVANTVRVHITNNGNQNETGLTVDLKDGSTSVGSQGPISLIAGASQDVDFSWTPSGTGNHTLTARVHNGDTDNSNSTTVNVGTQSTPQAIWESGMSLSGPGNSKMVGTVSVAGATGPISGAVVTIHVYGGSWSTGYTSQDIQVTTGPNGIATVDATLPYTGYYSVYVSKIVHGNDTYNASKNAVWSLLVNVT